MRKVLIFRNELLPLSETFIAAQASALRDWSPQYAGLRRAVKSLPVPDDSILLSDASRSAELAYKFSGFAPSFRRSVARAQPHVIHAHFALDGVNALPLVGITGAPLVVTLHGYDATTNDSVFRARWGGRHYLQKRPELWRRTSLFLCVSEFIRQRALALGFPERKLRVHHIGIDRTKFGGVAKANNSKTVLFIGRLAEKKGCEYLLRAMIAVQKHCPKAGLIVLGDGPLRPSLERLAEELEISCKFLRSQPAEIVKEQLGKARVLCVPSVTATGGDSEGLPTVVMEAQAMGVPVVASRHAGIPEAVLDGETGLLCTERDCDELASNLLRFLEDDKFTTACGRRGQEWMSERFDLQVQTRRLEDHYADACHFHAPL